MYIYKRCLIIAIFIIVSVHLYGQFPGSRQSGGLGRGGDIQQTNFTDTTQRPPFSYKSYDLNHLREQAGLIDTLIGDLHKLEPYYEQSPIGGNLGSEYSSSFDFFYDYAPTPLALGQNSHHLLLEDDRSRILYETNRDWFETVYTGSSLIDGSQFKLSYYKPFARQIFLNFNYTSYTDRGFVRDGTQSQTFKQLNLKLYQRSKSGKRISYINYDNPRITEGLALRIDAGGNKAANDGATVFDQRRKIVLGNSILLGDSTAIANKSNHVETRLTFAKDLYSLSDVGVIAADSARYQLNYDFFNEDSLFTSLNYANQARRISLYNSYHQKLGKGDMMVGLDISHVGSIGDSVVIESYIAPQLLGSYEQSIGDFGNIKINASAGFGDIAGDIRSAVKYTGNYKNIDYELRLDYDIISPTLSKRLLYAEELTRINYEFGNTNKLKLSGLLKFNKLGLAIKPVFQQYKNLILPDFELGWTQHNQSISIAQLSIEKKLDLWFIKTNHRVHLQTISNETLIPRPKLQYHGSFHFNLKLFKKKMDTQWGVETYLTPSFGAPRFQPIWSEWYQNSSLIQSDHIIVVNPYLNMKVDRLFFFIKGINVTRNFLPHNPTWSGEYPVFAYRVRFGLRWTLLD